MPMTSLDGRAFGKFVVAGTYFLRKYRAVLNDLNVFPVPDGDTGSNMYLTARAAVREAALVRNAPLPLVAAALARGSLLGARGNSGVILAQMFRGFARSVDGRGELGAAGLAAGMLAAVTAARSALANPVEGTIITVAQAAADAAAAPSGEADFYPFVSRIVRAANAALDRTPGQLPALKEAGVVDAGGAGLCYFLEGALSFLPGTTVRATAFPRRPLRSTVFTGHQVVGEHRFCTEFVLEDAGLDTLALRDLLAPLGDSLIVAGSVPTIKVHVHTGHPADVQALAARHGTLTRVKVEDMARQHRLLVVDAAPAAFSIAAVVPGPGFERIARELGADATIRLPRGANPSVEDLLVGVNATLTQRVYLLANDPNVALAAGEVAALTEKEVIVVPSRDIVRGLAVLLALGSRDVVPAASAIDAAMATVVAAAVFFAGKDAVAGGVAVRAGAPAATIDGRLLTAPALGELLREVVRVLAAGAAGVVTLYYGGQQTQRDAQRFAAELGEHNAGLTVECYFGGQPDNEYWVSFEL
jgi:fatty acid kinase